MQWSTMRQRFTAIHHWMCGSGSWLDWLFPRHCALCDGILTRREQGVCSRCEGRLAAASDPVVLPETPPVCAIFPYRGAIRRSVLRMKYEGRAEYAGCYGRLLAAWGATFLRRCRPNVLVPVPQHRKRALVRPYNQAEEIARAAAKACGIPMRNDLVRRVRHTAPQNALGPEARRRNLAGAFRAAQSLRGYRVVIVDDIYTTGATVHALGASLAAAGAQVVGAICVCTDAGRQNQNFSEAGKYDKLSSR